MRHEGSPAELEHRRRLAVQRVLDGYSTQEVAEFLGVDPSSVRRWVASFRRHGAAGLAARPAPGRPPKLTRTQEKVVLHWLADSPAEHGFATELWTGRRLAAVIAQEWDVRLHPRYLTAWLRARGYSPQRPQRVPGRRDPEAIARWLARDWPRIKKRRGGRAPASP
ncbi:MAG TPA: IS630 family transposase [Isosphaeraceae bacterium]|jgi:transposase|nr:IS630 family transposase [Isosphaeraceae bacterium]